MFVWTFFWLCGRLQHMGSKFQFPDQGWNLHTLALKTQSLNYWIIREIHLEAYFIPNSFYFFIYYPYIAPSAFPVPTSNY